MRESSNGLEEKIEEKLGKRNKCKESRRKAELIIVSQVDNQRQYCKSYTCMLVFEFISVEIRFHGLVEALGSYPNGCQYKFH